MKFILTYLILFASLNCFSQQPIFATIAGGDLYSFNLTNCTRHFIGSTGQGFGDIAFTPDGRLWGIVTGDIYHIDTTTANATLIGFSGIQAVSLVGLNDSIVLAEYGMKLYGINVNNASSYYIDTIGYQASGDLTWYDNDLYMVTSGSLVIKMVLNSTNTALVSVTPINSLSNPIPGCEGAATASFMGDYNSIIGFNGADIIKICQIDGSYQMLCPSLNIGGTPGAASIRLPTQVPQPVFCSTTSIAELNYVLNINLFPNPFSFETIIQTNEKLNNATLTIYNSLGQMVKQIKSIREQTITLQRDNLTSGIYFIQLTQDNKTLATDKLIISDN